MITNCDPHFAVVMQRRRRRRSWSWILICLNRQLLCFITYLPNKQSSGLASVCLHLQIALLLCRGLPLFKKVQPQCKGTGFMLIGFKTLVRKRCYKLYTSLSEQINTNKLTETNATNTRTYQCSRSACKKADKPSMMRRMATVRTAKKQKTTARMKPPPMLLLERPMCITMVHSTSASSVHGTERAHRLQYCDEGASI